MSEERFDRLEKMMAQLIQMASNNNASIEELRQEVKEVRTEVKSLKESYAAIIELIQQSYRDMDKKLDIHAFAIREDFKSVAEVTGDHEIRIRTLTRRPV